MLDRVSPRIDQIRPASTIDKLRPTNVDPLSGATILRHGVGMGNNRQGAHLVAGLAAESGKQRSTSLGVQREASYRQVHEREAFHP